MRRVLALLCISWLASGASLADESTPLLYSRTDITIARATPPQMPWQQASDAAPLVFDTEIREGSTLYSQKGWFNLSGPSPLSAVMMIFAAPTVAPIIPSTQFAPLDILLVDKEGRIIQIVPNLLLSDLEEEIYPASPISAFLFLRGGVCEKFSIRPGDHVEYARFKKPPQILYAPAQPLPNKPPSPQPAP